MEEWHRNTCGPAGRKPNPSGPHNTCLQVPSPLNLPGRGWGPPASFWVLAESPCDWQRGRSSLAEASRSQVCAICDSAPTVMPLRLRRRQGQGLKTGSFCHHAMPILFGQVLILFAVYGTDRTISAPRRRCLQLRVCVYRRGDV